MAESSHDRNRVSPLSFTPSNGSDPVCPELLAQDLLDAGDRLADHLRGPDVERIRLALGPLRPWVVSLILASRPRGVELRFSSPRSRRARSRRQTTGRAAAPALRSASPTRAGIRALLDDAFPGRRPARRRPNVSWGSPSPEAFDCVAGFTPTVPHYVRLCVEQLFTTMGGSACIYSQYIALLYVD
jgi:hypothetical protein